MTLQNILKQFISTTQKQLTIAKEYVTKLICKFCVTESLLTDQGTSFMSKVVTEVYEKFKNK